MLKDKTPQAATKETRFATYCNQIIIAILFITVIAVSLFFGTNVYSVFDLSKITILSILVCTVLAIWSIRNIILCWKNDKQAFNVREGVENAGMESRAGIFGYYGTTFRLAKPLNLPILAFLLVTGLATIFSIHPYTSLLGTYKRYDGFSSTIIYVCLFYAIVNFIEKKRLNTLINTIIFTACIASILGILQHFKLGLYEWNVASDPRVFSTFGHPAFFSAFLIMVIPLVLVKIFSYPSSINSDKSSPANFKPYLYFGILALLTVTFYYTKTRACFLGLIISNIFFFSLIGRKNFFADKIRTIVTLTILIGVSIFYNISDKSSVIGRFVKDIQPALLEDKQVEATKTQQSENPTWQEMFSTSDLTERDHGFVHRLESSVFMRVFQYITGLEIIYDFPLLGIGPETLGMIYPQYCAKIYKEWGEYKLFQNQNRIHSDFLDMTVSRGLLGLGVYLWFIFAYSRMVWKGYKKSGDLDKILIIGLCSGCLAYFIQNQFSFGHIPIMTLFWFLIGMSVIVSPVRYAQSNRIRNLPTHNSVLTRQVISNRNVERLTKCAICVIIICLVILFITLSLFRYKADIYFYNARKLLNKGSVNEAINSYEMAVRYNPLEINYRNVLNGIYLRMAAEGLNENKKRASKELSDQFAQEQTTMLFTKAISGAKEVQRLYPRDHRSAFQLGQAYHVLGKESNNKDLIDKAFKYYEKVRTLYPFKFELRMKLADFYTEKHNYQQAIQELKEAIRISPHYVIAYINLAEIFIKLERYEEALKSYTSVFELPESVNAKYKQYINKKLEDLKLHLRAKLDDNAGGR